MKLPNNLFVKGDPEATYWNVWRHLHPDGNMIEETIKLDRHHPKTPTKFANCQLGLYKIYWNSGGHSVASVGYDACGNRWFAPTNWVSGHSYNWGGVKEIELIATQSDV